MKFSIITPSYNQGSFISQTIESVISQNGDFEIEYFVLDGGSSDNTIKILKDYENKLKNNKHVSFYWQSKPDKGQADAINTGIKMSTGDIISYINSDDYYLPGAFKSVNEFFSNNKYLYWVVGNCKVSDSKLSWTFWLKHHWPIQLFKNALLVFNTINQPAVFLRKTLVNKIGYFEITLKYAFDYDYWLRCNKFQNPGRIFNNLAVFRIHQSSKGNTGYLKQFKEDYYVVNKYTNNKFLLLLHKLGDLMVNLNYKYLK